MPLRNLPIFRACWGKTGDSQKLSIPLKSKVMDLEKKPTVGDGKKKNVRLSSKPPTSSPKSFTSTKVQSGDLANFSQCRAIILDHRNTSSSFDSTSPDDHLCRYEASCHRTCQLPPVPAVACELFSWSAGSPKRVSLSSSTANPAPRSPVLLVEEEQQSESEGADYATVGQHLIPGRREQSVDDQAYGPGESSVQPEHYSTVLPQTHPVGDTPSALFSVNTASNNNDSLQRLQLLSSVPAPGYTTTMDQYAQVCRRVGGVSGRELTAGDNLTRTPQLPMRTYGQEEIRLVNSHRSHNSQLATDANQTAPANALAASDPPRVRFMRRLRNVVHGYRLRQQQWYHRHDCDSESDGSRHYHLISVRESLASLSARNALPLLYRPTPVPTAAGYSTPTEYEHVYGSPVSSEAASSAYEPLVMQAGNSRIIVGDNTVETRRCGASQIPLVNGDIASAQEHASDGYTEIEDCFQRESCGRVSSRSSVGTAGGPYFSLYPAIPAQRPSDGTSSGTALATNSLLVTIDSLRHVDSEGTPVPEPAGSHYYSLPKDVGTDV